LRSRFFELGKRGSSERHAQASTRSDADSRKGIRSRDEWDKCVERGGPSLTVLRGKTHYAASLMSAADQQIPDDTRVVLEELITETGR
jgi:hypothetical protein